MERDGTGWTVARLLAIFFIHEEESMVLRGPMRDSAARYLRAGERAQAVIGGQTASACLAGPGRPVVTVRYNAPSPVGLEAERDFRSFGRDSK
jgi:hypothetical protein